MGTAIIVASGKGGTGKSTTVAAVASCIASRGHKTVCIDCDIGLKNLDIYLGMTGMTALDFGDVLRGDRSWREAAVQHPNIRDLYFISSPAAQDPHEIDGDAFRAFIDEVKENFEYCFIDAPAGIGAGFRLAGSVADEAIIITTGDAAGLRDGQRTVAELKELGVRETRLVINRLNPKRLREITTTVDDIIDSVGARLIGIVSESSQVMLSGDLAIPLVMMKPCRAMREFNRISLRVEGARIPLGKIR